MAAGEGFVAAGCSIVMLAMSSLKLLFASFVLVALLMASSMAATSFCSFLSDYSSIKIFHFPLILGVIIKVPLVFSPYLHPLHFLLHHHHHHHHLQLLLFLTAALFQTLLQSQLLHFLLLEQSP